MEDSFYQKVQNYQNGSFEQQDSQDLENNNTFFDGFIVQMLF